MALEIMIGTKKEWDAALPRPEAGADIPSYYQKSLLAAEDSRQELLCFQSVAPAGRQSDDFALIGDIERTILTHMKEHTCPRTVRIICDNDDTARLYKVVYNFWFAADKPSRMDDDEWD